jgi:MFS family permease
MMASATEATSDAPWHRTIDRSGWTALIASFLGWMFDGYETYVLVLVAAPAVRQLVAQDQLAQLPLYIGGLFAATLFGWATGGVIAGVLADYIGRKRTLMLSILWYALFAGLTALSPSYGAFLVFRFLTGLGLGAEWGPGTAIVNELWPPSARGRGSAVLQSAIGFGFLVASGAWLIVAPLGPDSWRYMFLLGILPALLLLYIRTYVTESALWAEAAERRRTIRERALQGEQISHEERELTRFTMTQIFVSPELRRRLLLLLVLSLTTIVGWWAVSTWMPLFAGQLAAGAGRDAQQWAALTGVAYNVAGIAGYLVLGVLGDTWGRKPSVWLYYLGSLIMVPVFFLLVKDPLILLIAAAINGFFTLGQFTWMAMYLPELFPTRARGTAISLVFDSSRYVAGFGPLLAGWLITNLGGIATAATIIGTIYILGLIVTPFVGPETKGKPLPA